MADSNIKPTRGELRKLKSKLKTAQKGHKLLKDKTNELVRTFHNKIKENKDLRVEVEKKLKSILDEFQSSKTTISESQASILFALPSVAYSLEYSKDNLLSVEIPKITMEQNIIDKNMPYSPLSSTSRMDRAVADFFDLFPQIIKLAELEKTTMLLINEIEKCKRRVNALENILIPDYKNEISSIELKLSENEIENIARLKHIKSTIIKK